MAYRSSTTTAYLTTASVAPAVPAGAAINDIAIVDLFTERTTAPTVTPPSGFTLDVSVSRTTATTWNHFRYWKRLTAADSGTYSFGLSTSGANMSVCALFSGRVTTGSPFDVASDTNVVNGTSAACPAVALTPVTAGVDLVYAEFNYAYGASASSNPSGWTQATFHADGISMSYKDDQAATATGATSSALPATDWWTTILSALLPVPAVPLVAPTVSVRAAGSTTFYSPGTTAVATAAVTAINPLVPAGTTTDDLCVLTVECKPYSVVFTTPAGWTKIGETTNGVVASGIDVGSVRVAVYVATGLTGGTYIGAIGRTGTASTMAAVINSYSKVEPTSTWDYSVFATGGDSTNGANFSATPSGSLALTAGDMVLFSVGINSDLGTFSAQSLGTFAGATLTGFTVRAGFDVTTGNDSRISTWDAQVSAGSSVATPAATATNASSTSGSAMWLRLREVVAVVAAVQQPIWHMQAVHRATEW